MDVKLAGDLYLTTDRGRTLSAVVSGPVTMKGDVVQDGQKGFMEATGTMKVGETRRWLKLAGKPVPAMN